MKLAVTAAAAIWLLTTAPGEAARIGELVNPGFGEQTVRFFSLQDAPVRYALAGSMLLGLCCGLMGTFLVVRKLSMMGDALSHAVLPGVALGFLWTMTKNPVAIFIGAVAAALLGAVTVEWIRSTTKHREDAALGFVLSSFFGAGIVLFTMTQSLPGGSKSGLDGFMFGQAAALGPGDVLLLAAVTILALGAVIFFHKEYVLVSFDEGFARSLGWRVRIYHYSLMLLLAFAIVSALQAVGVVLVSAMLVIPAATAFLLTNRMATMLTLSAVFGVLAGGAGAFFSFTGRSLPTGPFMVLAAAVLFALALLFAPRHGVIVRWSRHRSRVARIERENTLKALYHTLEDGDFSAETVPIEALAERRREPVTVTRGKVRALQRAGLATEVEGLVVPTPDGWRRACEIVRNHRLWELYLTNAAQVAPDHVHDDAEVIEHVLGNETVRRLERSLNYARRDPHGKLIPGLADLEFKPQPGPRAPGFGTGGRMP